MTDPATFTKDLIVGFGTLLAEAGIGLAWPASSATGDETGIYAMQFPQSPDRIVTLSPVPLSADTTLSQSVYELQVRSRGNPGDVTDAWALDDSVANTLTGRYPLTLSTGIKVVTLDYLGGGSLGQDDNQRWMWSSNYRLDVHRPGTFRQ